MSDSVILAGLIINLIGVVFAIIQTRIGLERRISVLETYMKILLRDKGISIRSDDTLAFKHEKRHNGD